MDLNCFIFFILSVPTLERAILFHNIISKFKDSVSVVFHRLTTASFQLVNVFKMLKSLHGKPKDESYVEQLPPDLWLNFEVNALGHFNFRCIEC